MFAPGILQHGAGVGFKTEWTIIVGPVTGAGIVDGGDNYEPGEVVAVGGAQFLVGGSSPGPIESLVFVAEGVDPYSIGDILPVEGGSGTNATAEITSIAYRVTLPLPSGSTYNCLVDWGDGSSPSVVTAYDDLDRIHDYADEGPWVIEVTGTMAGWGTYMDSGVQTNLTDIVYWGDSAVFDGFDYLWRGFKGCSNLKSFGVGKIPAHGGGCTTFYYLFGDCTAANDIPPGLLSLHPNVTSCTQIFVGCTSLTDTGSGLFDAQTLCTTFEVAFGGDTALTSVASDLFQNNTSAENFNYVFIGCSALQIPATLFYEDGAQSTRFAGLDLSFEEAFTRSSFTGVQGTAPDLWNCAYNSVVSTHCFFGSGNNLTSISNYASIPVGWK